MKIRHIFLIIVVFIIGCIFVFFPTAPKKAKRLYNKYEHELQAAVNVLVKEKEMLDPQNKIHLISITDENVRFDGERKGKTKNVVSAEALVQVNTMFSLGILDIRIEDGKIILVTDGFIDNETAIVYDFDNETDWLGDSYTELSKPNWYVFVTV